MYSRSLVMAALIALSPVAFADQPDILPGEWEFTSTTSFPGTPMPPQTLTQSECVTAEDIETGFAFDLDIEDCEVTEMDKRRDGMNYTLTCRQQGMEMTMVGEIRFMGDRTEGSMDASTMTPIGPMNMRTELEGRRIGDC